MAAATAGDPCRALQWKHKSLRRLSAALGPDHAASAPTVARWLDPLDFSRQVNHQALARSRPHRDEPFQSWQAPKQAFGAPGWPVIYVDTKQRERIGWFKHAGAIGCRDPQRVNGYDFRSRADGIAIPYGIDDPQRNAGFVSVGISADTAACAVDAMGWGWQAAGQVDYPAAPQRLIWADGGGSNGYRPRLWKYALQHNRVNATGLSVTVCHYPTGASQWSWVEHRRFSPISLNWAGEPLSSYEQMLHFLETTTTEQGLVVTARLTQTHYPKRIKISDAQMAALNLTRHQTLPEWNYTLKPTLR